MECDDAHASIFIARRALPSDYDAVISLDSNAYDGFDYLAHRYNEFMTNKNFICGVIETKNRVVSMKTYISLYFVSLVPNCSICIFRFYIF